jgi:hypothetical protein
MAVPRQQAAATAKVAGEDAGSVTLPAATWYSSVLAVRKRSNLGEVVAL